MAATKIEWTEKSWNPVTGCDPVSPGCANCYAKRMAKRLQAMGNPNYANGFAVTCHPHMLDRPLKWRKPRHVFVTSMSDLFHDEVLDEFIAAVFGVMAACKRHTFQVLTKRPERMRDWFEWYEGASGAGATPVAALYEASDRLGVDSPGDWAEARADETDWPLPNVWLGVTAEDQQRANERIPVLLQIPAAVRFVSVEPMLEDIDFGEWDNGIQWVICGCESGPKARPMRLDGARRVRDHCQDERIQFFLKQARGEDGTGKLVKMPELDGRTWAEVPRPVGVPR